MATQGTLNNVFEDGTDGYACYREPALLQLPDRLLAFAEGRMFSCSRYGRVDIVSRTSTDGGVTWSTFSLVHSESNSTSNVSIIGPAPVLLSQNTLMLAFSRNGGQFWGTVRSTNKGASWSNPTYFAAPYPSIQTGPGGALRLPSGRVLVPAWLNNAGVVFASALYSDDSGLTWELPAGAFEQGAWECIEGTLAFAPWLGITNLVMIMRSGYSTSRPIALSNNSGTSWGVPGWAFDDSPMQAAVAALPLRPSGPLLAVASASSDGMTIHSSTNGNNWAPREVVYRGVSGYCSLISINDFSLGLLFESGSTSGSVNRISFIEVDMH